mmetsp:Transcript_46678/g.154742  ORF Transcript_46678/g.154742 Transcript_46678/m.154742 type:complete len:247 (+) Transcript_46678:343-1083(+)
MARALRHRGPGGSRRCRVQLEGGLQDLQRWLPRAAASGALPSRPPLHRHAVPPCHRRREARGGRISRGESRCAARPHRLSDHPPRARRARLGEDPPALRRTRRCAGARRRGCDRFRGAVSGRHAARGCCSRVRPAGLRPRVWRRARMRTLALARRAARTGRRRVARASSGGGCVHRAAVRLARPAERAGGRAASTLARRPAQHRGLTLAVGRAVAGVAQSLVRSRRCAAADVAPSRLLLVNHGIPA